MRDERYANVGRPMKAPKEDPAPNKVKSFTVSCTPAERKFLIAKYGSLTNVIKNALQPL